MHPVAHNSFEEAFSGELFRMMDDYTCVAPPFDALLRAAITKQVH